MEYTAGRGLGGRVSSTSGIARFGVEKFSSKDKALENRTCQVNTNYYVRARRVDEALANTRCVDILQRQGRLWGLAVDNRGVISKDLKDLIELAAKSAAKKKLGGQRSQQRALRRSQLQEPFP